MADTIRISLAAARVNACLTAEKAAESLGICKSTLLKWESGKTSPTMDFANRISELYGIPVENIFFGKRLA